MEMLKEFPPSDLQLAPDPFRPVLQRDVARGASTPTVMIAFRQFEFEVGLQIVRRTENFRKKLVPFHNEIHVDLKAANLSQNQRKQQKNRTTDYNGSYGLDVFSVAVQEEEGERGDDDNDDNKIQKKTTTLPPKKASLLWLVQRPMARP
ncbi:Hypothetical protein NTJ_06184 [Nesidiocoris tenuis]|uniref:Uncharacterized protein n=1 Tax=Nesidiocoris tenuis TaxID=355587 RepID=A0ABN7AR34_9HEMI|nr:Hypothetical protein NTJ_06184 [Nesidiocoris tenuis]